MGKKKEAQKISFYHIAILAFLLVAAIIYLNPDTGKTALNKDNLSENAGASKPFKNAADAKIQFTDADNNSIDDSFESEIRKLLSKRDNSPVRLVVVFKSKVNGTHAQVFNSFGGHIAGVSEYPVPALGGEMPPYNIDKFVSVMKSDIDIVLGG